MELSGNPGIGDFVTYRRALPNHRSDNLQPPGQVIDVLPARGYG
jgi:hypothetical protein